MESIKPCSIAPASQQDQDHEIEAQVFQICARAGVCCIGIQSGFGVTEGLVLFSKPCTTLAIPLSTFADPEQAIKAIKAKIAQSRTGETK
jgi:hypothetical protein